MYLIAPDAPDSGGHADSPGTRGAVAGTGSALETPCGLGATAGKPRHSPTLRQLEKAAAALGKRLVLALE